MRHRRRGHHLLRICRPNPQRNDNPVNFTEGSQQIRSPNEFAANSPNSNPIRHSLHPYPAMGQQVLWMPNKHRRDRGLDTAYVISFYILLQVLLVGF